MIYYYYYKMMIIILFVAQRAPKEANNKHIKDKIQNNKIQIK